MIRKFLFGWAYFLLFLSAGGFTAFASTSKVIGTSEPIAGVTCDQAVTQFWEGIVSPLMHDQAFEDIRHFVTVLCYTNGEKVTPRFFAVVDADTEKGERQLHEFLRKHKTVTVGDRELSFAPVETMRFETTLRFGKWNDAWFSTVLYETTRTINFSNLIELRDWHNRVLFGLVKSFPKRMIAILIEKYQITDEDVFVRALEGSTHGQMGHRVWVRTDAGQVFQSYDEYHLRNCAVYGQPYCF